MKKEIIEVFVVHGDGGEGGLGPVEGYCKTREDAEFMAVGRGWWGGPGKVTQQWALLIDGETYFLSEPGPSLFMDVDTERQKRRTKQERADAELRAETLSHLSSDQKRVLGITTA
jgi:hypothetical protein